MPPLIFTPLPTAFAAIFAAIFHCYFRHGFASPALFDYFFHFTLALFAFSAYDADFFLNITPLLFFAVATPIFRQPLRHAFSLLRRRCRHDVCRLR